MKRAFVALTIYAAGMTALLIKTRVDVYMLNGAVNELLYFLKQQQVNQEFVGIIEFNDMEDDDL